MNKNEIWKYNWLASHIILINLDKIPRCSTKFKEWSGTWDHNTSICVKKRRSGCRLLNINKFHQKIIVVLVHREIKVQWSQSRLSHGGMGNIMIVIFFSQHFLTNG